MVNPITLEEHDAKSDARAESIKQTIHDYMGHGEKSTGDHMNAPGNYFSESALSAGGGGFGAGGFGAGLVGGVLGGLLFDRKGGIVGGDDGSAETRLQDNIYNTAVMSKLGAIEAAIPFNEGQVQLALAQQTISLGSQATANANAQAVAATANAAAQALAIGATKDAVQAAALISAGQTSSILAAIAASTNTITSKIDAGVITNLQAELAEARAGARAAATEVNVTQNVNQNQAQAQAQQQMQSLASSVACLVSSHQNLQQGLVNLGTMVGNTQSAANTRVN